MDSKVVSRIWWAVALRGILAVLFGIMALIFTGQTLLVLVYVFGAFALIAGMSQIVTAVRAGEAHLRWGWLAFAGIISVAAGIVAFVWPGITALALLFLIAAWALITGVAEIVFALSWPDTLAQPWLAALSGALSVVFGILLVVWPRSGVIALTWLVGIYAILYGISQLYYLFRLQGLRREVRQTFGPGHGAPAAS
jgi:uncharacterized membrane protein HdeD (DUF308 family)